MNWMRNPRSTLCSALLVAATGNTVTAAEDCRLADEILASMRVDTFFQQPYVDMDEWRDTPVSHRYVHGGFEGTETRFSLYLPPVEDYEGRFFQYITPVPMSEFVSQGREDEEDFIGFSLNHGAYFIETNGGGMKALAEDSTIGAYRANAAVAQYSRIIAMEMYGCERPYGYSYGGSGGGYRTLGGMENTKGVWDGAVPYVIGSPMAIPNVFTVRMYALRVLGDKLPLVADAMDVGSDVDLVEFLTEEEYAAFQEVTRMGFPRQGWYIHDKLDLHGYASLFPGVVAADPKYFNDDFWTLPGYEGHQSSRSLLDALVEHSTNVKALVYAHNAEASGLKQSLIETESRGLADDAWKAMVQSDALDAPVAIELESLPDKNLLGADLHVRSGSGEGGQFLVTRTTGNFVLVGNQNVEALARLTEGDEVLISNRNVLASQTYHRHQVPLEGYPVYDQFRDENGDPIYPQREVLLAPNIVASAVGSIPTGKFEGKMIVVSALHDTEAYPWQGNWYLQAAKSHLGNRTDDHIRLWYVDRAPHGDVSELQEPTQMVSYLGILQQALLDVSAWVEQGIEPAATTGYTIKDGQVHLSDSLAARGGIQPIVRVQANGGERAEVNVGEPVKLTATIEVPEGTGKLVYAAWDFDGSGDFSMIVDADELGAEPTSLVVRHTYDVPGTYFVTLQGASQRDGDAETPFKRIRNLARARVIVE